MILQLGRWWQKAKRSRRKGVASKRAYVKRWPSNTKIEQLEDRLALAAVDVGILQFVNANGFTQNGTKYTATDSTQVGFTPASGQSFVPLITLNSGTTIDTAAGSFSTNGTIADAFRSTQLLNLNGANFTFQIGALTSATGVTVPEGSGSTFTAANASFTLKSFAFKGTGSDGAHVQVQGSLALPAIGLTVAVDGGNYVDISTSGVSLTGINASINGSFNVGGVTYNANGLTVSYTANNNVFTLYGAAGARLTGLGAFSVQMGTQATPGLVITNGSLTTLNTTLTSSITVQDVTFATNGLSFAYNSTTSQYTLTGSAGVSIGGINNLNVTFGHVKDETHPNAVPGLVVTSGRLTSLDMTVNSSFTVSSVTVSATNLELTYDAAGTTPVFGMSGTASVAVEGMGNLAVTFGHVADARHSNAVPGLVVTGGELTSLDLTVNGSFTVSSVTVTVTDLELTYDGPSSTFGMTGTAGVNIGGLGNLSVTFGHSADNTPGIVITDGKLISLDLTVNGTFAVSLVTLTATDLELTYDASGTTPVFAMRGTAGVAIAGMGALSVTFGHDDAPGLVVTGGALTSLDLTINGSFTVSSVTITAYDLEFTYSNSTFAMIGTASVAVAGMGELSVTFGHIVDATHPNAVPGLVVTNGSLTSLDVTVTGFFTVKEVTVAVTDVELTYSGGTFSMTGTASVLIEGLPEIKVSFGHAADATHPTAVPGLVVTNGALTSLDVTVTASFTVSSVTVSATNLELTYTASTSTFTLTGAAGLSFQIAGQTQSATAIFGYGTNPGLVITNGALVSMDLSVSLNLSVAGATLRADNVRLTYVSATSTFQIVSGSASLALSIAGQNQSMAVTFGYQTNPGLVITGGSLTSLDLTFDSTLSVAGVTLKANSVRVTYVAAKSQFRIEQGSATLTITNLGNVTVTFGDGTNPGLVITGGKLTSLNLSVTGSFTVGSATITADRLTVTYDDASGLFTFGGGAGLSVAGIANLHVRFGDTDLAGTVNLVTVGNGGSGYTSAPTVTFSSPSGSGGMAATGVALISGGRVTSVLVTNVGSGYSSAPTVAVAGGGDGASGASASASILTTTDVHPGLLIQNGNILFFDMTVDADFQVASVTVKANALRIVYVPSESKFSLSGSTSLTVGDIADLKVTFGYSEPAQTVTQVSLTDVGSGYTSAPKVEFAAPAAGGTRATGLAILSGGQVSTVLITNGGSGYTTTPEITFSGGGTVGAVTSVSMVAAGSGYTSAPTVQFSAPTGTNSRTATGTALIANGQVAGVVIDDAGSGYSAANPPTVTFSGGVASGVVAGQVTSVVIRDGGSGYTSAPTVTLSVPGGSGQTATGTATLAVASVTVTAGGSNYSTAPKVTFADAPAGGTTAQGHAVLGTFVDGKASVVSIVIDDPGSGYTSAPTITLSSGGGKDATATAAMKVGGVTIISGGSGYTALPTVTFNNTGSGGSGASGEARVFNSASGQVKVFKAALATTTIRTTNATFPGLVIQNGSLQSMDMTINANFSVAAVTVQATGLRFTYRSDTSTFTLAGSAGLTVRDIANLHVTFGYSEPFVQNTVKEVNITNGGSGYTSSPIVIFSGGGGGSGAAGVATIANGRVTSVLMTSGGSGYTTSPNVSFIGGGTSVTAATAVVALKAADSANSTIVHPGLVIQNGTLQLLDMTIDAGFEVSKLKINVDGLRITYTGPTKKFTLSGSAGLEVTGIAHLNVAFGYTETFTKKTVSEVQVTNGGSGYLESPTVIFSGGGGGSGATGVALIKDGQVTSVLVTSGGSGYTSDPQDPLVVSFSGGGTGQVSGVRIDSPGSGYTSAPTVTFEAAPNGGVTATGTAVIANGIVTAITMTNAGRGYTSAPRITFTGGGATGSGASARASIVAADGQVTGVTVSNGGSGFATAPAIEFSAPAAGGTRARGRAVLGTPGSDGKANVVSIIIEVPGRGYSAANVPTITFSGGGGTGASAQAAFFKMASATAVVIGTGESTLQTRVHPGLVIQDGSLQQLDMTANAGFEIGPVKVYANNVRVTYTADGTFTLSGTAGVVFKDKVRVEVSLGWTDPDTQIFHRGIVIQNGRLQELNASVDSEFNFGQLSFGTRHLGVTYIRANPNTDPATPETWAFRGGAFVHTKTFGFDVDFGKAGRQGLIVQDGELKKIDVSVSGYVLVKAIIVGVKDVNFSYDTTVPDPTPANPNRTKTVITLSGTVRVALPGDIAEVSVSFGIPAKGSTPATPGLVLENGELKLLAFSVDASFDIKAVTFNAGLHAKYIPEQTVNGVTQPSKFEMYGETQATVAVGITASFAVRFGTAADPGLLVEGGTLRRLNLTITADLNIRNVVVLAVNNLTLSYRESTSTWAISGSANARLGSADKPIATLAVSLGTASNPGIVLTNGRLTRLHLSVSGNFTLLGFSINADSLTLDYQDGTEFTVTGGASITVPSIGNIGVYFGTPGAPGLVVDSTGLKRLEMAITGDISLAGITFDASGSVLDLTGQSGNFTLSMRGFTTAPISITSVNTEPQGQSIADALNAVLPRGVTADVHHRPDGKYSIVYSDGKTRKLTSNPGSFIPGRFFEGSVLDLSGVTGSFSLSEVLTTTPISVTSASQSPKGKSIADALNALLPSGVTSTVAQTSDGKYSIKFSDAKLRALATSAGSITANGLFLKYKPDDGGLHIAGKATLTLPKIGPMPLDFGAPGDDIIFKDGKLIEMDIQQSLGFNLGSFGIQGNLHLVYKPGVPDGGQVLDLSGAGSYFALSFMNFAGQTVTTGPIPSKTGDTGAAITEALNDILPEGVTANVAYGGINKYLVTFNRQSSIPVIFPLIPSSLASTQVQVLDVTGATDSTFNLTVTNGSQDVSTSPIQVATTADGIKAALNAVLTGVTATVSRIATGRFAIVFSDGVARPLSVTSVSSTFGKILDVSGVTPGAFVILTLTDAGRDVSTRPFSTFTPDGIKLVLDASLPTGVTSTVTLVDTGKFSIQFSDGVKRSITALVGDSILDLTGISESQFTLTVTGRGPAVTTQPVSTVSATQIKQALDGVLTNGVSSTVTEMGASKYRMQFSDRVVRRVTAKSGETILNLTSFGLNPPNITITVTDGGRDVSTASFWPYISGLETTIKAALDAVLRTGVTAIVRRIETPGSFSSTFAIRFSDSEPRPMTANEDHRPRVQLALAQGDTFRLTFVSAGQAITTAPIARATASDINNALTTALGLSGVSGAAEDRSGWPGQFLLGFSDNVVRQFLSATAGPSQGASVCALTSYPVPVTSSEPSTSTIADDQVLDITNLPGTNSLTLTFQSAGRSITTQAITSFTAAGIGEKLTASLALNGVSAVVTPLGSSKFALDWSDGVVRPFLGFRLGDANNGTVAIGPSGGGGASVTALNVQILDLTGYAGLDLILSVANGGTQISTQRINSLTAAGIAGALNNALTGVTAVVTALSTGRYNVSFSDSVPRPIAVLTPAGIDSRPVTTPQPQQVLDVTGVTGPTIILTMSDGGRNVSTSPISTFTEAGFKQALDAVFSPGVSSTVTQLTTGRFTIQFSDGMVRPMTVSVPSNTVLDITGVQGSSFTLTFADGGRDFSTSPISTFTSDSIKQALDRVLTNNVSSIVTQLAPGRFWLRFSDSVDRSVRAVAGDQILDTSGVYSVFGAGKFVTLTFLSVGRTITTAEIRDNFTPEAIGTALTSALAIPGVSGTVIQVGSNRFKLAFSDGVVRPFLYAQTSYLRVATVTATGGTATISTNGGTAVVSDQILNITNPPGTTFRLTIESAGGLITSTPLTNSSLTSATIAQALNALHLSGGATVSVNQLSSTRFGITFNDRTVRPIGVVRPTGLHRYSFTNDASDGVGTANGTLEGGATISTGAVTLVPSRKQYVSLPIGNDIANLSSATFQAWVTLNDEPAAGSRIFDFGSGTNSYMYLTAKDDTGKLRFAIRKSGSAGEEFITVPVGYTPMVGVKTYVAVTIDAASHTGTFYYNGVPIGQNTNMTVTPADLGVTNANYLGKAQISDVPYLNGSIDEFRMYPMALTAVEVAADYHPDRANSNITASTSPAGILRSTDQVLDLSGATDSVTLTLAFGDRNVTTSPITTLTAQGIAQALAASAPASALIGGLMGNVIAFAPGKFMVRWSDGVPRLVNVAASAGAATFSPSAGATQVPGAVFSLAPGDYILDLRDKPTSGSFRLSLESVQTGPYVSLPKTTDLIQMNRLSAATIANQVTTKIAPCIVMPMGSDQFVVRFTPSVPGSFKFLSDNVGGRITPFDTRSLFTLTGSASLTNSGAFPGGLNLTFSPGLVIRGGEVEPVGGTFSGGIDLAGIVRLQAAGSVEYKPSNSALSLSARGTLQVTASFIPKWLRDHLNVSADVNLQIGDTESLARVHAEIVNNGSQNVKLGDVIRGKQRVLLIITSVLDRRDLAVLYDLDSGELSVYGGEGGNDSLYLLKKATGGKTTFKVSDGPLAGATIYYDAQGDFDLVNDPYVVTASDGTANSVVPADATGGQLVVTGGTDIATGQPNNLELTAPFDAGMATPLTTLVTAIMRQASVSKARAEDWVHRGLDLNRTTVVDVEDSIAYALGGGQAAAKTYATTVKVGTAVSAVANLLSGRSTALSASRLSRNVFDTLASYFSDAPGVTLDLGDARLLHDLITKSATAAGLTIDDTVASKVAQIIAGIVGYIGGLPVTGTEQYLDEVTKAQVVAAGSIAPQLSLLDAPRGRIVVSHDEWALSDTGFTNDPENTNRFVQNLAKYFAGDTVGKFLAYSSSFGLTQSQLASAMTAAGIDWTVSTDAPFTLENLRNYNAVFLGGDPLAYSPSVLAEYVNAGGNVYLMAGTSGTADHVIDAAVEAGNWNPFLEQFGLQYDPSGYNSIIGNIPIASAHPIFKGVSSLYSNTGNSIIDLTIEPSSQVVAFADHTLLSYPNPGLYAVATTGPDIDTLFAQYSGANLDSVVAAAEAGTLYDGPPLVSVEQVTAQPVGYGDPASMGFTVYLTTTDPLTEPVTVQYTTQDGTATAANGDYTTTTGTLTWQPGDTEPKTIEVPIHATDGTTANRYFTVTLSNTQNATLGSTEGVGVMQYTDFNSATTLTSSTTDVNFGDAVTLTATVANQDPTQSAAAGTVSFMLQDGSELGEATLVNGQASLTTSDLHSGVNTVTAVYLGLATDAAHYAASTSSEVVVTISGATQTITFGSLADETYGAMPVVLDATASSGRDVFFRVVSGPATLEDNLLTITGAGTIVVEARQPGSSDFQPADPVLRSFQVAPAHLTYTIADQAIVYGQPLPPLTGDFSGFVNGDDESHLTAQPTLTSVATGSVGTYALTASGVVSHNYVVQYVPGTLQIEPALLIITPVDQTIAAGRTPALTVHYTGFVNGDTASSLPTAPTLTVDADNVTDMGQYSIIASGAVAPNYDILYDEGILTVLDNPSIVSLGATFLAGTQGSFAIEAVGFPTVTLRLSPVSVLPNGITWNSARGTLSGTASTASVGSYTLEFTADNGAGRTTTEEFTLLVTPGITFTTLSLPAVTLNKAFLQTVTVSGGSGFFSFTETGALHNGLSFSSDGILSGTPTTTGTFHFTVTASDPLGVSASHDYSLTIDAPIAIDPTSSTPLAIGTVNDAYRQAFTATGGSGTGYSFIATGRLPQGMAFSRDGVLSGTPTKAGVFNFTVTATDSDDGTESQSFSVRVTPIITLGPMPTVPENSTAVFTVPTSDSELPIAFAISGGADADRFTIDSASGALAFATAPDFENPTDADGDNVYVLRVTAADETGRTSERTISVGVMPVNDNNPVITSARTVKVPEFQTAVLTVSATDADLPKQGLVFDIVGGADSALFAIDHTTGALRFRSLPDALAPKDAGADNTYNVVVQASDGTLSDAVPISITVQKRTRAAQVDGDPRTPLKNTATFRDANGDQVTVMLTGQGKVDVILIGDAANDADIAGIHVADTNLLSKLTLSVKKAATGDGKTSVLAVVGTALKSLDLATTDLRGTIELAQLETLKLHDVQDGSLIRLGGNSSSSRLNLMANKLGVADLVLPGVVDAVTVNSWAGGQLTARALGTVVVKNGSFGADVTATGTDPKTGLGLNSLTVTGGNLSGHITAARTGKIGVANGRFLVGPDQTIIAGTVIVGSGGTLAGTGSIAGTIQVLTGGTLAPGAEPGQPGLLTVGNLSFAAGSSYVIDINSAVPGTGHDQLAVTGSVTVNGLPGKFGKTTIKSDPGHQIVLVQNDGTDAVRGTAAGFAEGNRILVNNVPFYLSHAGGAGGNDVTLTQFGPVTINGTNDADRFEVRRVKSGRVDSIQVLINGSIVDARPTQSVQAITINGGEGNDILTVNDGASGGFFPIPVTFHGDTGTGDRLVVKGGTFKNAAATFTNLGNGLVLTNVNGNATTTTDRVTLSADGLEQLDLTASTIANLGLNLPGLSDLPILEDDGASGNGITQLRSQASTPTFPTITFANPRESVAVGLGSGAAALTVASMTDFDKLLNITDGSTATAAVTFAGTNTFAGLTVDVGGNINFPGLLAVGADVMFKATDISGAGSITVGGEMKIQATGNVALTGDNNFDRMKLIAARTAEVKDINGLTLTTSTVTTNLTVTAGGPIVIDQRITTPLLEGGLGNDTFVFGVSGSVTGQLDGGGGTNSLDYSRRTSTVSANLVSATATSTGGVANIQNVIGGSANDTLVGNDQANVLVGNGGNDTIKGGGGRDLIIGGLGADSLQGDDGEDLLIGGTTAHDANVTALNAIMAEWTRTNQTYSQRIDHLRGTTPGGSNGSVQLKSATVFDDANAIDKLFGGLGLDWFFKSQGDLINDLNSSGTETITMI